MSFQLTIQTVCCCSPDTKLLVEIISISSNTMFLYKMFLISRLTVLNKAHSSFYFNSTVTSFLKGGEKQLKHNFNKDYLMQLLLCLPSQSRHFTTC